MADSNIKIWAELTLDNKQIKTEFTKAGEEAGKSVAQWLEKSQWNMLDLINETVEKIRWKIETLQEMDWNLIDPNKIEPEMKFLDTELTTLKYNIENLKYWRWEFWDEWKEAFEELKATAEEYEDTIYNSMDVLQTMWMKGWEAMDEMEEQTKQTAEAVKELNNQADKWISENGWLWKMLKTLGSAQIINFFYKNITKIWKKLIELSGDSERLWEKRWGIQGKLEAVWWYIGKWLTPVLEWIMDDINGLIDGFMNMWSSGQTGASMIQKGVFWIATFIRWLVKLIQSVWTFLGAFRWWQLAIITNFASDVYNTIAGVIKWIWNVNNRKALWNNIKYWIVDWVNGAIKALNGMLWWIRDKLWIDLWKISEFDAGQKMEYEFDISFQKTKDAMTAYTQWVWEAISDIGKDRADFFSDTAEWWKWLWNTSIDSIKKTDKEAKKTYWKWWSVNKSLDQLDDEAKEVWDDLDAMVEEHQKNYDKLKEEIKKIEDEFWKLRDKAKDVRKEAEKALKDYNEELSKAQWEAITDLWQRYVELKKDLVDVDSWMKKVAEETSRKEIQFNLDNWYWEIGWYNIKDIMELKEKLEELQLIEENTTEEQRKEQSFIKETSKTQEILNKLKQQELEIEEKKAAALEKQAIATAMQENAEWENNFKTLVDEQTQELKARYKDRDWIWQEIHNADNIEYAKQLETQVSWLNQQLEEFIKEKDKEVEFLIDATATKIQLEEQYTKVVQENAKKQKKELDDLIAKTQRLIDKQRELNALRSGWGWARAYWWDITNSWVTLVWENGPEQIIARQSAYVQPRNASNSYSTVNNDNSFSINGMNVNVNNVDDFLDELKQKMTYRN